MLARLGSFGLTPELFYGASIASVALSLIIWFLPRDGSARAETRRGLMAIFVGLWPPTLFIIGHAMATDRSHDGSGRR